jgi:hypothetical protein
MDKQENQHLAKQLTNLGFSIDQTSQILENPGTSKITTINEITHRGIYARTAGGMASGTKEFLITDI